MSGHSKWANIKHRKQAQDAKRSKIFSKLSREIEISIKEGGSDPEFNPRLRMAIQNAKSANMPKDNIERAIKKASQSSSNLEEVTFEGYGPGGVAIFVEAMTDNNNRTVSAIRSVFHKRGGSLGQRGSLKFIFDRKGIFRLPEDKFNDELELELIDAGAEDIELDDGFYIITTSFEDYGKMSNKLNELGIEPESAELERIPVSTKEVDAELAKKVMRMIDELEDLDDVQKVYHNMELTDDILKVLDE